MRSLLPAVFSALLLSSPLHAQQSRPGDAPALPLTRVALYKSGVGFFEHTAHLTGTRTLTLDFTSAQLNDVLQTLTAVDLGGGQIGSAKFNSTTPLAQQIASLPFSLGDGSTTDVTEQDLYNALRGARVEVTGAGPVLTGRILSLEVRGASSGPAGVETGSRDQMRPTALEQRVLTVVGSTGATRSLTLTSGTTVRLLDAGLRANLNTYLALLDQSRSQGMRHLTLTDQAPPNATGQRELRVSFLSEVPVWKSTYRVLLSTDQSRAANAAARTTTLQGFSVIDNTTGEDWKSVHLSLIAGSPQSFLQPLAQPIYTRRPEIPIAEDAQLTPQTHDAGELLAPTKMLKEDGPLQQTAGVAGMAGMAAGGVAGGVFGGMGSSSPPVVMADAQTQMAAVPYATLAQATTVPSATTGATETMFAYNLSEPISIPRNGSALVPILTASLPAESVTLWSAANPTPLRALSLINATALTLDRGSFSVVEDGSFAGEGLLDTIHPGEHRLLSFAADQAIRVAVEQQHERRRVTRLAVHEGVLHATNLEIAEADYVVSNASAEDRTVLLEEPRRVDWTLDSPVQPVETTPTALRFRVIAIPHGSVRLHVAQRHTLEDLFRLVNTNETELSLYLRQHEASPALLQKLTPVFAAQRRVTTLEVASEEKRSAIRALVEDQKRLRDNLAALKGTLDERALARRYTGELNAGEDTLARLRQELATVQQQQAAGAADLAAVVAAFDSEAVS